MSTVHLVFLVLTFTLPLLFCGVSRWRPSVAFDRSVCRGLALVLLATAVVAPDPWGRAGVDLGSDILAHYRLIEVVERSGPVSVAVLLIARRWGTRGLSI